MPFLKKIEAITVQPLVQSPGKFLCVIWNLVTKPYQKFVTLSSFFKIFKNFSLEMTKYSFLAIC